MSNKRFQRRLESLIDDLKDTVFILCHRKGEGSKHYNHKCLIPDGSFMCNFTNSKKYIAELTGDYVYDDDGNQYDYNVEDMEVLCYIVDHLIEKYS